MSTQHIRKLTENRMFPLTIEGLTEAMRVLGK